MDDIITTIVVTILLLFDQGRGTCRLSRRALSLPPGCMVFRHHQAHSSKTKLLPSLLGVLFLLKYRHVGDVLMPFLFAMSSFTRSPDTIGGVDAGLVPGSPPPVDWTDVCATVRRAGEDCSGWGWRVGCAVLDESFSPPQA